MVAPSQTAVDTVRAAAANAASAVRISVGSHRSIPGVWLRLGSVTPGKRDETRELLEDFSPDFVICPDATPGSRRPSDGGVEDYHPRAVSAYLDRVTPYVASPQGLIAGVYVLMIAALLAIVAGLWLEQLVGVPLTVEALVGALVIDGGVLAVVFILVARAPVSVARLQRRIRAKRRTNRLGIRRTWFEPPLASWWANHAWSRYEQEVVSTNAYPRRIYGRSVTVGAERYLQYWQFYVFNDWHNKHEADWELVVVRVAHDGKAWVPLGAVYSSHFGGHWRPRAEIDWRDCTHPTVYVAQGSHAQYFDSTPATASLTQSIGSLRIQVGRTDWTDEVANRPLPGATPYEYDLAIMPDVPPKGAWPAEQLQAWWWLAYRGLWGGGGAITGPVDQGKKWSDPVAWVADAAQRDSLPWSDLRVQAQ